MFMQLVENKKIFFLGLFLLCMQLLQGMNKPYMFYVCAKEGKKQSLSEYAISSDGNATVYPCALSYKKGTSCVTAPLSILEKEQTLLKDILQSPSVLVLDKDKKCVRTFCIEDILFSNTYEKLAEVHGFWGANLLLIKTRPLWEEVIVPSKEVFDVEEYFSDRPTYLPHEEDETGGLRRALKRAIFYQCLCKKLNALISKLTYKTYALAFSKSWKEKLLPLINQKSLGF